jgi:hypothetical protein
MQLTRAQRQLLVAYREFHLDGVSLAAMYRKSWRGAVLFALYFTGAAAFCFAYDLIWMAAMLIGLALGSFLRDYSYMRRTVSVWPVVSQITDWGRVDQMLPACDAREGHV